MNEGRGSKGRGRSGSARRARRLTASDWLRGEERLGLVLLGVLLLSLCVAGGASRASEMGQIVVRTTAIVLMMILCATRRTWSLRNGRAAIVMIAATGVVVLMQLIPMPPVLWTWLPGRAPFEAAVTGPQPWRPINLTPDAGLNALLSLSVPLAAVTILTGISARRRGSVADLLLAMTAIAALLGSLQLGGAVFDNPFINETVGEAAGIFANRNHQALFLACGLPLVARWAFAGAGPRDRGAMPSASGHEPRRGARGSGRGGLRMGRMAAAGGLAAWLLLLILATGSRAGLFLALAGMAAGAVVAWPHVRAARASWPRWVLPAVVLSVIATVAIIVAVGLANDRALALRRLVSSEDGAGIRASSLPILWNMVRSYFPFGSGFGSFDPVFRIVEPFDLLKPTYFNHAHNDLLEIVIEAGLAGLALAGLAIAIWVRAGRGVWKARPSNNAAVVDKWAIAFVGWSILTMVLAASLVDYPVRTPTIMVLSVIALWLTRTTGQDEGGISAGGADGDAALPS